jgi:phosphatidylglycerol:prolipoprotein diacylglycerol transferase
MYPTLFTIGNLNIPTYTVLLDLGLILGLLLTYYEGRRQLDRGTLALDFGLWIVIGGILGGRIGYVLANWSVFSEDWASVIRIWEGGLSFHGAVLGGLLVMTLFALLHRRNEEPVPFWQLADVLTPGLALGIAFGWAACLLGGCAYGILGEGIGYAILPDLYGVEASRFATQAVGLGYSLLLFLGVWLMRRHWPFAGASFLLYTFLYFAGQFFLEFTRGDEAIYVGPWRLAQVLNLVLALAAGVALLVLWWRWRTVGEEREEPIEEVEETQATGDAPEVQKVEGMDQEPVAEEPVSAPQSAMPEERDDPAENEELEGDSPTGECISL